MKLLALALLVSLPVLAQTKHQVTLGNSMAGWSGSSTSFVTDKDKGIKDFEIGSGNINLNYAYSLTPQLQLGAFLKTETGRTEQNNTNGDKFESDESDGAIYLFATFNFSDVLNESFYLSLGFGGTSHKEEFKDTDSGVTTKSEFDYTTRGMFVSFGKRFTLSGMGIQNLTFSPAITIEAGSVSGDLEDSGVERYATGKLDLIKFDLLF